MSHLLFSLFTYQKHFDFQFWVGRTRFFFCFSCHFLLCRHFKFGRIPYFYFRNIFIPHSNKPICLNYAVLISQSIFSLKLFCDRFILFFFFISFIFLAFLHTATFPASLTSFLTYIKKYLKHFVYLMFSYSINILS